MEHSQSLSDPLILTVMLVCAAIIAGGAIVFHLNKDVRFRKRLLIFAYAFFAVVVLLLLALFRVSVSIIAVAVPALIVVLFLQFRMAKFCASCGRMTLQRTPLDRFVFCPRCGAKYEE